MVVKNFKLKRFISHDYVLIAFILYLLLLLFVKFSNLNFYQKISRISVIVNSIVFIFLFGYMLFYFIKKLIEIFKKQLIHSKNKHKYFSKLILKNKNFWFLSILISISFYLFFVIFSNKITGRFVILEVFIRNFFMKPFIADFLRDPRTYTSLLYFIFHGIIPITPFVISYFTRIFAILTVIVFYYILKLLINDEVGAFFISIFLLISYYFVFSSISIESIMFALFFTYLAIYFYLLFFKTKSIKKRKKFLHLSYVSIILAVGGRYELSLMLGISYLLTLFYLDYHFDYSKFIDRFYYYFLLGLISFSLGPLKMYRLGNQDPYFRGKYSNWIAGLFGRAYHSLFINHQIWLNQNQISIFYYITLIIVFYYLIWLFVRFFEKSNHSKLKNHEALNYSIVFLIFYFIIYNVAILFFHVSGLSCPEKYNLNFYLIELILVSYFIYSFCSKLYYTQKVVKNLALFLLFILFILSMNLSPYFYIFRNSIHSNFRADEMNLLNNVSLDSDCKIIKHWIRYPYLDFYKGQLHNDVVLGNEQNIFYDHLSSLFLNKGCYYYFNGYYSDEELDHENIHYFNLTKIKEIASQNNCSYNLVFSTMFRNKNILLLKFVC